MAKRNQEEGNNEKVTAYKINLDDLLNSLVSLYEEGVDYVDLEFRFSQEHQNDAVRIIVKPEYYANDGTDITDENINDLI